MEIVHISKMRAQTYLSNCYQIDIFVILLKHFLDWFHILPNFQNQIFDMDEDHVNLQKLDTN